MDGLANRRQCAKNARIVKIVKTSVSEQMQVASQSVVDLYTAAEVLSGLAHLAALGYPQCRYARERVEKDW
jgi:hypothetical protein